LTKPECTRELLRLSKGFNSRLTPMQQEAFFERLKSHDVRDFTEAVTTLLCAPYFPRSIELIHETTVSAKEMRLEGEKAKHRRQEEQAFDLAIRRSPTPMDMAFAALCASIITEGVRATATAKIEVWIADPQQAAWARQHGHMDWLEAMAEQYAPKATVKA